MNNGDILNFNGSDIKIEDIFKKPTKEILIGLYIKTQDLEKSTERVCGKIDGINTKIDNQWAKIGKNQSAINWVKGVISILSLIVLYLLYNLR